MSLTEKVEHLAAGQRIQMEEEVILRQKFIAHRAQVQGVKKSVEPDDRQQEEQKAQIQKAGDGNQQAENAHQRDTALHISQIHLTGAGPEGKQKSKDSAFSHSKNSFGKRFFPKPLGILINRVYQNGLNAGLSK